MALTFQVLQGAEFSLHLPDPIGGHLAAELRKALGERRGAASLEVSVDEARGDGFAVTCEGARVEIAGGTARRALDGVYWLLESVGAVYVEPGIDVPLVDRERRLEDGRYEIRPAFPKRSLVLGSDGFHDDWRDWMAWASRNRYDDIFFHDTPPSKDRRGGSRPATYAGMAGARGGWLFERWDEDGGEIVRMAAERCMTLQFGGHHLATVLPRSLFEEHPDWFAVRNGTRDPRYNFCTSNPAALDHVAEGAAAFAGRFEGATTYHLWADDIRGGGWCSCEACGGLSPADQALRATNAMADPLAAKGVRIAHLAYRDTLAPPERTEPADNVDLLFAPRERCYAHSIDDAACERNRRDYWEPFAALRPVFGGDAERVAVFEYYSDGVLFKGLAPPHQSILPSDAAAYSGAAAGNLQNLMVGPRPWLGPPLHAWWFGRVTYEGSGWEEALGTFTQAAFPQCGHAARHYYGLQDESYLRLLDTHDLEQEAGRDVLDFGDVPRATLRVKANEALSAAAGLAARHQQLLKISSAIPHERERIARERLQAEYVSGMARHLANRMSAWQLALDGRSDEARPRLLAARRALADVEAWTAQHTPAGYAVLATGMLRAANNHTEAVAKLI